MNALQPITYSFHVGNADRAAECRARLEHDGYEVVLLTTDDGIIIVNGQPPLTHDELVIWGGIATAFISMLVPIAAWVGAFVVLPCP